MLRIAPDVNVLVSGVLTPSGLPGRIMAAWRQNQIVFVVSSAMIEKMVEVLRRPHIFNVFSIEESDIQNLRTLLTEAAVITPGALDLQVVKEDPEDDTLLIAAVEGKADCIVSGDRHLKNLGSYQKIPIRYHTGCNRKNTIVMPIEMRGIAYRTIGTNKAVNRSRRKRGF